MGVASKMCFFRCFPFGAVGGPCTSGGYVYDVLLANAGVRNLHTLETKVWDVTGGGMSESGSLGNIAHAREVK